MDHSVLSYLERLSTERLECILREYGEGEGEGIYDEAMQNLLMVLHQRYEQMDDAYRETVRLLERTKR